MTLLQSRYTTAEREGTEEEAGGEEVEEEEEGEEAEEDDEEEMSASFTPFGCERSPSASESFSSLARLLVWKAFLAALSCSSDTHL